MPRAGVTKDRIFAAAEAIANREGFAGVTLAGIAVHFGIRTPSLYKHIKNLEQVQEHLALCGYRGLRDALQAGVSAAAGEDRMRAVSVTYRRFARENPGLYAAALPTHLAQGPAVQATAVELLETIYEILRELKIPEKDLLSAARSLRSAVHGFVSLELAGGFGLPEDLDQSFDFMIEQWLAGRPR